MVSQKTVHIETMPTSLSENESRAGNIENLLIVPLERLMRAYFEPFLLEVFLT